MSFKKILLLASMALATVAFAVPATASALLVKDSGTTVAEETVTFSGEAEFNTLGSGIKCTLHATVTITNGVPSITASTVTTPCTFFGTFVNCEFETNGHPLVTNLPQTLDIPTTTTLTLTGGTIDSKLQTKPTGDTGTKCPTTKNDLTVTPTKDVTLDLITNGSSKITGAKITGTITDDQDVVSISVGVAGTLTIDAAHSGTYNVE